MFWLCSKIVWLYNRSIFRQKNPEDFFAELCSHRGLYCADFNDFCTDWKLRISAFYPCKNHARTISIGPLDKVIFGKVWFWIAGYVLDMFEKRLDIISKNVDISKKKKSWHWCNAVKEKIRIIKQGQTQMTDFSYFVPSHLKSLHMKGYRYVQKLLKFVW